MVHALKKSLVLLRFLWRGILAFRPRYIRDVIVLLDWALALKSDSDRHVGLEERCSFECYEELASFLKHADSVRACFLSQRAGSGHIANREPTRCNVVVRLDCDSGDVKAARKLIDIFCASNVNLSAHILVDGAEYDPRTFRDVVRSDLESCKFGLHSACWTRADPRGTLVAEIETFQSLFGFLPESISLHGELARDRASLVRRSGFIRAWNAGNGDLLIHHTFDWTCQDSRISMTRRKPCVNAERLKPLLLPKTIGNVVLHNNYVLL